MKHQIEAALRPLVGEPLTGMLRYAGYQRFEFGVQRPATNRRGEAITRADVSLVVGCDWRVTGPEGEAVSSEDFGPGRERRDEAARPFYALLGTSPPVVEAVEAEADGELRLRMSQGYTLEVRPDPDLDADEEQWRFLPADESREHVVLCADGLTGA